ncbi:12460_t:CDS:2, partial [Funneliformis geosporum]
AEYIKDDGNRQPQVEVGGFKVVGFSEINALGNKAAINFAFVASFKAAVPGASLSDIIPYGGKNLTGAQAAALYNETPRIPASIVKDNGTIDFTGVDGTSKNYDLKTSAGIAAYQAAKKAKDEADAAERERQRKETLKTAKSTAISTLQDLLDDTSNNQTKITNEEVKTHTRENKVKEAIAVIRKAKQIPPFVAAEARQKAIEAVKKNEFDNLNDQTAITNKQTELTGKIDTEKTKEPKQPEQKPSLTEEESMEMFQTIFKEDDATQIVSFITENVKGGQEKTFAKYLEEKLGQKPTGNNEIEKVNNFLTSEKAEKVIKVIFSFKVENDASFRNQTETEMNNWKEMDGKVEKVLDETVYQKKDGKFTPEAMARFLYEEKTGTPHQFAKKEQTTGDAPTETSH